MGIEFKEIRISKKGGGHTVHVELPDGGAVFDDCLTPDEALGVVAAALFAGSKVLPYVRTAEHWEAYRRRLGAEVLP